MRSDRFPIAYVAGAFPLRSETFVWREVRELRRRGWTVHTFGLRPPAEVPPELADLRATTSDVYSDHSAMRVAPSELSAAATIATTALRDASLPGEPAKARARVAGLAQARAGCRLAWRLRTLGVRHVHAHFAHAPASVAMYAARFLSIPFSFTGHANDLFQRRQLLRRKLERAAFVACISEWHRDLYRSIVPRDDDAYPIVRCGVEVDLPSPSTRPRVASLLTVCRLVEKKGVDTLIRAVARVRTARPDVSLTVAGDGPLRGPLESLARELSVADRVRFVGGVDSGRVTALLSESDCFALPCRVDAHGDRDGIPVVLMEAMAAGVPVVAGDLPAIRELVVDGATGLLVAGDDPEALAGAIGRMLGDAGLADRLAGAGRARVVNEFSLSTSVSRLESRFRIVSGRCS